MRYEDYYELSEKHGWRATDLDWDALKREQDAGLVSDFDRKALEGTTVIEHGVPHYGEVWTMVEHLRRNWELWQFTTLWTGEEHRHSFVLKKACDTLGFTDHIADDLAKVKDFPFAATQKASCPTDCYRSVPGMLAYTVIQELATNKFYGLASKETKSPFMKRMFQLIAGDEMRHHVFYREALSELHKTSAEKEWYSDQVYSATRNFKMPHLIYDVQMGFFENGQWSIGTLGKVAFKAQLARCFAFDARLLARLLGDGAATELERSGNRAAAARASAS
jgi:hypothetical protein